MHPDKKIHWTGWQAEAARRSANARAAYERGNFHEARSEQIAARSAAFTVGAFAGTV